MSVLQLKGYLSVCDFEVRLSTATHAPTNLIIMVHAPAQQRNTNQTSKLLKGHARTASTITPPRAPPSNRVSIAS